jgi:hypothetical protein
MPVCAPGIARLQVGRPKNKNLRQGIAGGFGGLNIADVAAPSPSLKRPPNRLAGYRSATYMKEID